MLLNLLLSLAPVSAAQQVWTVDDDGPADFPSIAAAIPQVAAGDVLMVQPGAYEEFTLDKSLSILAPAGVSRPVVNGESVVTGAAECSFVHMKLQSLELASIPGRIVIDDCEIGPPAQIPSFFPAQFALLAQDCGQMLVTRTEIEGPLSYGGDPGSVYCAAHVVGTEACFAGCELFGGDSDNF